MIETFLKNLNIPSSCHIGRRLTKKQFLENFTLTANEKKILSSDIEKITLAFLLNKENINIQPFLDEERDYTEIAFIVTEIKNPNRLKRISTVIQHIPYPLIIFFVDKNRLSINISPKRINKNDTKKLVVEESFFTEWIELDNLNKMEDDFLKSLQIENHPFSDFLSFYNSYLDKILAFNASKYSGILHTNQKTKVILHEIEHCEIEIVELRNRIKKETNFSEKVNLNIELKRLKDKVKSLKRDI